VDAADGLGRGLTGLRIQTEAGGRPLRGRVSQLRPALPGRRGARLVLSEAEWNDLALTHLMLTAEDATVTLSRTVVLSLTGVAVHGRVAVPALVEWHNRDGGAPRLALGPEGGVEAALRPGGPRLALEPLVREGVLQAELRGLRWGRLAFPLAGWLRLRRPVPLPPLAPGFAVVGVRREGDQIEFALVLPPVELPFWRR
jgi:hypothetical protein